MNKLLVILFLIKIYARKKHFQHNTREVWARNNQTCKKNGTETTQDSED